MGMVVVPDLTSIVHVAHVMVYLKYVLSIFGRGIFLKSIQLGNIWMKSLFWHGTICLYYTKLYEMFCYYLLVSFIYNFTDKNIFVVIVVVKW